LPSFKSVTTHRSRLFNNGLGFKRPVKVLSAGTTYALKGSESGILLVLNSAFGSNLTITLPPDTAANIGFTCTIFVAVNITGTLSINAAADTDVMVGAIKFLRTSAGGSRAFQAGSADDGLTIDANTKGRLEGSIFDITIAAANIIAIDARGVIAGSGATAFADNS
jgi:hypothetical protein